MLSQPLQSQMQSGGDRMHIAVVGAGVAGPALVALLGQLERRPQIDIFEGGAREMEQGGGYDLNNESRNVLKKAGVMDRYWEMTRPDSNFMSWWFQGQDRAFFTLTQPRWAHCCFGPKYETNRSKLREVLLDVVENNVSVKFDCPVQGLRQAGRRAELLGKDGTVLGEYDLIIDASGAGSSLRRYRVQETATDTDPETVNKQAAFKKAYTGVCMVHGVIWDPETSCDERFVNKLGQGTVSITGPRGRSFAVQRFGADPADHRASFYWFELCPDGPGQLQEMIGLATRSSEWQSGTAMEQIRSFLHSQMGGGWEPANSGVIDAINFAAIRPILLHDQNPTFRDNQLPLICIGDALHVVPPWTGAGGNLAMADALDLAALLMGLITKSQPVSIDSLRELEQKCMSRAAKKTDDAHKMPDNMRKARDAAKDIDDLSYCTCSQLADVFMDDSSCQRICCKSAVCCCRPACNRCGCCRC